MKVDFTKINEDAYRASLALLLKVKLSNKSERDKDIELNFPEIKEDLEQYPKILEKRRKV